MGRRRKKQIIRKLTKQGKYSYYVTLPIAIVKDLRWQERQKLVIKRVGKAIKIIDWKK